VRDAPASVQRDQDDRDALVAVRSARLHARRLPRRRGANARRFMP